MRLNLFRYLSVFLLSLGILFSLLSIYKLNNIGVYADSNGSINELYDFKITTGEQLIDNYKAYICNNSNSVSIEFKINSDVNIGDLLVVGEDGSIIGSISLNNPYIITANLKEGNNIIRIINRNSNSEVYKFNINYKSALVKGLENSIKVNDTFKLTAVVDNKEYTNIQWKPDDTGTVLVNSDGTITAVKDGISDVCAVLYDDNKNIIGSLESKFNVSGSERIGWVKNGSTWYYIDKETKRLKTGWLYLDDDWYYLDENGALITGWISLDDNWYYLKSTGNLAIGWFKDDDSWYYAEEDGKLKTGWFKDHGNWYYFNENGKMQTSSKSINGAVYNFNKYGELQLG